MLHVHHADELAPLLDALVDQLGAAPADPFTTEVIVVPTIGMADLVMAHLARHLGATGHGDGVVAGIEFAFPGRFLARVLGDAGRPGDVSSDPWHVDRLTWSVLDELAAGRVEVPGPVDGQRWRLARHVADLFDRYATQRPRVIAEWAAGVDTDGTLDAAGSPAPLPATHLWQADLWRAVRRRIGVTGSAELYSTLLASLRRGELTPDLPSRVMVFGIGGLAPAVLGVVRALSEVRDVHVFWRHPSATAWSTSPHALGGSLVGRSQLDVTTHVHHPLLASWARPSLEARAVFGGVPEAVAVDHSRRPSPPSTLLGAIQFGIRTDTAPSPVAGIDALDGSFQVHACHGMARQLEALRDALGHAFVADPSLAAHEVLVLCPDLERVAPLVEAVFARGSLPVPVRVGDRSLTTEDPLVGALIAVVDLALSRASLSEVVSVLQRAPVRARLGWDPSHVEQLSEWCRTMGTRWGLEPAHRTRFGMPDGELTGTWRSMVDRLVAGMLMAAPRPRRVIGDVSPFDDLGIDDHTLVGGLADLVARLGALHDRLVGEHPVADWIALLHEVVDGFLATDEPWRRQQLHAALDDLASTAFPPGAADQSCRVPLGVAEVRSMIMGFLAERHGRLALRSGSVTVSSLVPQHGVPARIICLVGLDDGAIGGRAFDGDDVLGEHPCVGERHPRHEQRQLLLDTVLAAGERLIITCDGSDMTTNKEVPFVVPVAELLDVAERLVAGAADAVVVRHRRHGFAEPTLTPGALTRAVPGPFTFDPEMLDAAHARRAATSSVIVDRRLPPVEVGPKIDIDALVEVVTRPERTYLKRRLDIRVPADDDGDSDDALPIAADPLQVFGLGTELREVLGRGDDEEVWRAGADLSGELPPGALRGQVLDAVVAEVGLVQAATDALVVGGVPDGEVEVGVEVDLGSSPGVTVDGVVRHVRRHDGVVADVEFRRPKDGDLLGLAVRLAALQVKHPDVPWRGILVRRPRASPTKSAFSALMAMRGDSIAERTASATALLSRVVELYEWALRDAVPLFPSASRKIHTKPPISADDAIGADVRPQFGNRRPDVHLAALWSDSLDAAVGSVLATDPVGLDRGLSRVTATAHWVWGVFDATTVCEENAAKTAKTAKTAKAASATRGSASSRRRPTTEEGSS